MDAGTQLGPYRVVRQIGEGGMGAVYLAEHSLIGRRAAIKVLQPSLSAQPSVVGRFFDEARAITAIGDPGIVQVFDFGMHSDGSAYLVMELLDGDPLDARLRARGRLHVLEALRITRQLATSLAAAHARGVVHRDLKPENVFLIADPEAQGGERPKLLDFGIAKLGGGLEGNRNRTRTGVLMGTPMYMSPEQCRGAGNVDARTDVYSLGCVLYTMLTGRPPFDCDGIGEVISAHLREAAPPPSVRAPHVRPEIDALVARCLEKDPAARFPHMSELAIAIEQITAHLSAPPSPTSAEIAAVVGAPTPTPVPTTLSHAASARTGADAPAPRGRGRAIGLALVAVAIAIAAGGAIALRGDSDERARAAASAPVVARVPPPPPDAARPDAAPPDASRSASTPDASLPTAAPLPDAAPAHPSHRPHPAHPARAMQPVNPFRGPSPQELYDTR